MTAGIPDTFTGAMDFDTSVPADDCWNLAPHQWANQGCVTVSQQPGSIGVPLNSAGGGVYALEWDPEHRYMRSWVFPRNASLPKNLEHALDSTADQPTNTDQQQQRQVVQPDPQTWGLPYAFFAIGPTTGCSADHFKDMRIVFNLAFCGTVAGNRFARDCPAEAEEHAVFVKDSHGKTTNITDPVQTCNAYIASQPDIMSEAYWKIRGVYVYEREME